MTATFTNPPGIAIEDAPVETQTIAIELSNSQGKRYDGTGDPLIVQAAWTHTIPRTARGKGTNTSPQLVTMPKSERVWFGELAAEREHQSVANSARGKAELARFLLMPLLLPSDMGDLKLVMSYHSLFDREAVDQLEAVKGFYRFTRNGSEVCCNVSDIELVPEGMGAYWLGCEDGNLSPNLKTLAVELGYRTSEVWVIKDGEIVAGEPIEELGVYNLAKEIADDDIIRASILGSVSGSASVNPSQIAIALKRGILAKTPQWEMVKKPYIDRWADKVLGRILTDYSSDLNTIEQIVFSGGGAMLIRNRLTAAGFHVDRNADTASLRGAYRYATRS